MKKPAMVVVALSAIAVLGVPGCGLRNEPAQTEVVHVQAVGADGLPADGYVEDNSDSESETSNVFECAASVAAVSAGIYRCWPSVAGADVCWPTAQPGSLLCADDPWDHQLHRVTVTDTLPQVQPPANPQPFALVLDDGTRCRLRNGGAWGGRDDGYVGAYGCESSRLTVLVAPDGEPVDRSKPLWTVQVGELGVGNPHFPPPETRGVRTAWLAGHPDEGND